MTPTLVAVAMFPAIGEELVFRGVLARGLARTLVAPLAVLASACAFSAFHMNLAQLLPTFVLGLAFAAIALRADSCVPSMIAHALNNTVALLVTRDAVPGVERALLGHPVTSSIGALAISLVGIALCVW